MGELEAMMESWNDLDILLATTEAVPVGEVRGKLDRVSAIFEACMS